MNTPTRYESPPACIRRSKRLIRKTTPIPEFAAPVAEFETAVTSFENRYDAWALARHQDYIALGQQHEAEEALGQQVRGVGFAILTTARGRRRSEVYRRYFPQGYGVTLQLSAQDALGTAAGLLTAMADETTPDILARRDPLTAAQTALENAIVARQAALNALGEAKATLEEGKSAWRSAYNSFYFALRTIFPDRRQWVESLFKVNGRKQADDGQSANTGTTTTGGTDTPSAPPPKTLTLVPPPASAGTGSVGSSTGEAGSVGPTKAQATGTVDRSTATGTGGVDPSTAASVGAAATSSPSPAATPAQAAGPTTARDEPTPPIATTTATVATPEPEPVGTASGTAEGGAATAEGGAKE